MRLLPILLTCLCLLGLVALVLPISAVQSIRNDIAYDAVIEGDLTVARHIYRIGAWQNDPIAVNNYHVLSYRRAIDGAGLPKAKRRAVADKAKAGFERQMARGFATAAYNRGMFNYKCSAKNSCYQLALEHFEQGADMGDMRSRHAADFMQARQLQKGAKFAKIKNIANDDNPWAAYRYAKNLRFDCAKLNSFGEPYALIAAEAGIADAQNFLGIYFPWRKDAEVWLEKAARNPHNRSLMAAARLAELSSERKDYTAARDWLALAATPRADFDYTLIIEPEGLRWRGFQGSRAADANTSQKAAYDLALLQLSGKGGTVDRVAAMKNLEYADDWEDAKDMRADMQAGRL